MKLKGLPIAAAVSVAAAASMVSLGTLCPSTAMAKPVKAAGPMAGGERLFLTPAQLAQARAVGDLDRPVRSLLRVKQHLEYGDFVWNDAAVPSGPTWVRIDLHSQLISVFRAGHEIGTAVIVYGGDNKPTPTGKLHILGKARNHRSSLYDAEMPYTLRLTGDGVSIHGSDVRYGAASHGCIGVPVEFARHVFDVTHVGDDVVILPATRKS